MPYIAFHEVGMWLVGPVVSALADVTPHVCCSQLACFLHMICCTLCFQCKIAALQYQQETYEIRLLACSKYALHCPVGGMLSSAEA